MFVTWYILCNTKPDHHYLYISHTVSLSNSQYWLLYNHHDKKRGIHIYLAWWSYKHTGLTPHLIILMSWKFRHALAFLFNLMLMFSLLMMHVTLHSVAIIQYNMLIIVLAVIMIIYCKVSSSNVAIVPFITTLTWYYWGYNFWTILTLHKRNETHSK